MQQRRAARRPAADRRDRAAGARARHAAARLVAAPSLLFIAMPVVTQAVIPPPAHATEFPLTLVPEQQATTVPIATGPAPLAAITTPVVTNRKEQPTADYTCLLYTSDAA